MYVLYEVELSDLVGVLCGGSQIYFSKKRYRKYKPPGALIKPRFAEIIDWIKDTHY
ncbi:hypothetical protein JCM19233_83 [Vibrio astriarenae]|nr:hypothetical protein JCM19233_83 [Vibrio sp. C7]